MTPITRRDALILTTAAATATPALAAAAADAKATILVGDGVLDGSSIPIGLKIPHAALDKTKPTDSLTVKLHALPVGKGVDDPNDVTLFTLTVQPAALDGDVSFATRLKILKNVTDPKAQPISADHSAQMALKIVVGRGTTDIPSADQTKVSIGPGNCPPADGSTLRMSVQPGQTKANTQIVVKALAPQPRPTATDGTSNRRIKQIDLKSNGDAMLTITSDPQSYWSDETYFAFSYQQHDVPADLSATWHYDDDKHPLQATIFLAADT